MIIFDYLFTTGAYNFVSLIVKIILLALLLLLISFSLPATVETQYFVHLSFNSTLQLINGISSNLQKLLKYFNGTAIATFLKFHFHYQLQCFLLI